MRRLLLASVASLLALTAHAAPISSYPAATIPYNAGDTVIGTQSGVSKTFAIGNLGGPLVPVNTAAVTNGAMGIGNLVQPASVPFPCSSWGGIFPGGKTYAANCINFDWTTVTAPGGATVGPNSSLFVSGTVDSALVGNPTAISGDEMVRVSNGVGLSENFITATSGNVGAGPIINAKLYNEDDYEATSGDSIATSSIMHNYINFNTAFPLGLNFASAGTAVATGTYTFAGNPTNGLNIVINGVTWTFVTSGATGTQTNIQGTLAATLVQLAADLNASGNGSISVALYTAPPAAPTTLFISDKTPGAGGNSYTIATGTAASGVSGGTLAGGGPASILTAIQFQGPYTDAIVGAAASTYVNFLNNAGTCTSGCIVLQGSGSGNGFIFGGTSTNSDELYGDGSGDALLQLGTGNFFEITSSLGANNFVYLATLASGGLTINNTTASSSTTTGAIVDKGGLGVAGAAVIGGYVRPGSVPFASLGTADPSPVVGDRLVITDATTCTANNNVTAGSSTHVCPVIRGTSNWVAEITN